jgi:two-component system, OmpR family, sensor histidine kinase BaeS
MLNTLRGRFILSQILPLLVIIPLIGISTVYLVEREILYPSILAELKLDALSLSRIAASNKELWDDPDYARHLLKQASFAANGRLMLIEKDGTLIASTDRLDGQNIGSRVNDVDYASARQGEIVMHLGYNRALNDNIADALAPVTSSSGALLGFVRLSLHYYTFYEQIYKFRYLLTGILLGALFIGGGLGIILAINIGTPIRHVTNAVSALANGERSEALPEQGPEETRRLEHAVNVLFERLRNLEAARKRLLASLIHEIGRPLGAMRMGIEALSHGANQDPRFYAELLEGMDLEASHLQRLVEELLHLYEHALGALELERQTLDLANWLPGMLTPWRQAALQKQLNWELLLPQTLPVVRADPLRLDQVIGNLVSNAIKFTPAGGKVQIEAGETASELWIRICDTGLGVPLEFQEEIFEPFVHGVQGRRSPEGMGLGLTIARELVEAHGGRLELESKLGSGSTFTVWLPRQATEGS